MSGDDVVVALLATTGAVAVAAAVVGGLSLLFPEEPDGLAVCADPVSNERVDDSLCGDFGDEGGTVYSNGMTYMVFDNRSGSRYGGSIPAVGQKLPPSGTSGFIRTYPKDFSVGKGVEAAGSPMRAAVKSSVVRGGFGVKGVGGGS